MLKRTIRSLVLSLSGAFFVGANLPVYALDPPVISPSGGSFATAMTVTMSAPAGTIFYTLNGAQPSMASPVYSGPITVSSPTQIKSVAYQSGTYSEVSSAFLDIDPNLAPIVQNLFLRLTSDFGVQTVPNSAFAAVSQWTDLSTYGNNATSSAGHQPTYLRSSLADSIVFNGSSQFFALPPVLAIPGAGASFFLVVKPGSPGAGARFFDFGNGTAVNNIYMSEPSSGAFDLHVYRGNTDSSVTATGSIAFDQFQLIEGFYDGINTASIYRNGLQRAQSTSMQQARILTRSNNYIGQGAGGGNYYSGHIAEILIYNSRLNGRRRADVEAYLMNRYRLPPEAPPAPIISVGSGTLSRPVQVTISSPADAVTHITTDSTTPSEASPIYSGCPITINYSQTLKAVSIRNGLSSSVASAVYTLDSSQFPAPNPSDTTAPIITLQLPVQSQ